MILRWTSWIVQLLLQEKIISEDDQELYMYCFQTALFQMIIYGSIALLAVCLDDITISIAYYCGFLPIRYAAGGYHANSHKTCLALSIIIYLFAMGINTYLPASISKLFIIVGSICTICMIFWAAPVDHKNRPFSPREKERYRKKSYQVTILVTVIAVLMVNISVDLSTAVILGTFSAACSVWIGQKQRRRELLC